MNYMLLIYVEERAMPTPPPGSDPAKGCEGLDDRLIEAGQYLSGARLQPTTTATCIQLREGRRLVTDGPFAETREQLVGYMLVTADNLDEAIAISAQHPAARYGTVEVRPLLTEPYLAPTPIQPRK